MERDERENYTEKDRKKVAKRRKKREAKNK